MDLVIPGPSLLSGSPLSQEPPRGTLSSGRPLSPRGGRDDCPGDFESEVRDEEWSPEEAVPIPPHLEDLFYRSCMGLTPMQSRSLAIILNRYSDTFVNPAVPTQDPRSRDMGRDPRPFPSPRNPKDSVDPPRLVPEWLNPSQTSALRDEAPETLASKPRKEPLLEPLGGAGRSQPDVEWLQPSRVSEEGTVREDTPPPGLPPRAPLLPTRKSRRNSARPHTRRSGLAERSLGPLPTRDNLNDQPSYREGSPGPGRGPAENEMSVALVRTPRPRPTATSTPFSRNPWHDTPRPARPWGPDPTGDFYPLDPPRERIPTLVPREFDGSNMPWRNYRAHFERVARANHWCPETMAEQLCHHLTGVAGSVMNDNHHLPYEGLVEILEETFGPKPDEARAVVLQLRQIKRQPGQTLQALAAEIRDKVNVAYVHKTQEDREERMIDYFTDALTDTRAIERIMIVQPTTLQEAVRAAQMIENLSATARQRAAKPAKTKQLRTTDKVKGENSRKGGKSKGGNGHPSGNNKLQVLEGEMAALKAEAAAMEEQNKTLLGQLQELLKELKGEGRSTKKKQSDNRCFNCQEEGHWRRECPHPPKNTRATSPQSERSLNY